MTLHDHRKILTQENYSKISHLYAEDFGKDRDHFDFIDQAIKIATEKKINKLPFVDLGCGPGVVTDYLIEKGIPNIISIDLTPEFLVMVRKKHKEKVKIIHGDMVEILDQFLNSGVAAFIAGYSMINIPNEEIDILLQNIKRVLTSGGVFVMSCHQGTKKGLEQEPYQTQKDHRLKEREVLLSYMNYFTEGELTRRITNTGMEIVRLETFEAKVVPGEFPVPKIWLLAEKLVKD